MFERIGAKLRPEPVKLSELFGENPSILLYSFMFGPERDDPCTGCTHTLDGLDGSVFHADQRFPTYVVAKSPIERIKETCSLAGIEDKFNHAFRPLPKQLMGLLELLPPAPARG